MRLNPRIVDGILYQSLYTRKEVLEERLARGAGDLEVTARWLAEVNELIAEVEDPYKRLGICDTLDQ